MMLKTVKKGTTLTRIVDVQHFSCGCMSGEYGAEAIIIRNDRLPRVPVQPSCGVSGIHLASFFNQYIGDGATVEVTIKVLKSGKLKRNSWLKRNRKV